MKTLEPLLSRVAVGPAFVKRCDEIGICGKAPSDYPEFAHFLVEQNIDSISLNPNTVVKITVAVLGKETERN